MLYNIIYFKPLHERSISLSRGMTNPKSNIPLECNNIDLIKFIMAFAVIAIHTRPLEYYPNPIINALYINLVELAVPFFFLSSGYLLSKKMNYPLTESDIYIIKKHLLKIVKMYLTWMIIYTPLAVYHNLICERISFTKFCLIYTRNLLFVGEQYNSWPLWYLLSTIYSLFFIILLIKSRISPKGLLIASMSFSLISFGAIWFSSINIPLSTSLLLLHKVICYSIPNIRILGGMIYIPLGMLLAHNKLNLRVSILLFTAGFSFRCYFENETVDLILLVLTTIGFWGIINQIKFSNNNISQVLRISSTVIYLIHMYVWTFYYMLVYKEKTYGLDSFLITSLISAALSFLYIHFTKKISNNKT